MLDDRAASRPLSPRERDRERERYQAFRIEVTVYQVRSADAALVGLLCHWGLCRILLAVRSFAG